MGGCMQQRQEEFHKPFFVHHLPSAFSVGHLRYFMHAQVFNLLRWDSSKRVRECGHIRCTCTCTYPCNIRTYIYISLNLLYHLYPHSQSSQHQIDIKQSTIRHVSAIYILHLFFIYPLSILYLSFIYPLSIFHLSSIYPPPYTRTHAHNTPGLPAAPTVIPIPLRDYVDCEELSLTGQADM